jgi:hypothetical protein
LFIARCGEKVNEMEETPFAGQVSNSDGLIKHVIEREEGYDEAIENLD